MRKLKDLHFHAKTAGHRGRCLGGICDELANEWKGVQAQRLAAAVAREARARQTSVMSDEGKVAVPGFHPISRETNVAIWAAVGVFGMIVSKNEKD